MNDARNYSFDELTAIQERHLALWKSRLKHDLYAEVSAYVRQCNRAAVSSDQLHRVYRGQDIVQVIMDWPTPGSGYEPRTLPVTAAPAESVI